MTRQNVLREGNWPRETFLPPSFCEAVQHKGSLCAVAGELSGIIQQVAQEVQLGISAMIRGDGAYVATKGAFVDLLRSR